MRWVYVKTVPKSIIQITGWLSEGNLNSRSQVLAQNLEVAGKGYLWYVHSSLYHVPT